MTHRIVRRQRSLRWYTVTRTSWLPWARLSKVTYRGDWGKGHDVSHVQPHRLDPPAAAARRAERTGLGSRRPRLGGARHHGGRPSCGARMLVNRSKIIDILRRRGQDTRAEWVDRELPEEVDTDRHVGLLATLRLSAADFAEKP